MAFRLAGHDDGVPAGALPTHAASAAGLGERAGPMFDAVEELAGPAGRPVRIEAEYLLVTAS